MMKTLTLIAAGVVASAAVAQTSSSTQSAPTAGTDQVGTTGASDSASRNTNWTNDNTKPKTAFSASTGAQDNVATGDQANTNSTSTHKNKHRPR